MTDTSLEDLAQDIVRLFQSGEKADRNECRTAFVRLREELSAGRARAAEPDAAAPSGWRVNTWVKQGILLGIRWGDLADMSVDDGRWFFADKDTLPLKRLNVAAGVRVVPGGSAIRDGAYVARGVICMPPMYINIGAHIGEGSMIDSHALVGSCAQVGRRVHVSAGAQIGGVIEPVGALPVVIEDDVLIGGNTGIYEGAVVRARAVIGAGTILTGSTPLYDLPKARVLKPGAGIPLVVPEGAVVVPGSRAVTQGLGPSWGLSLSTPVIVKYRDDKTDARTSLEEWVRDDPDSPIEVMDLTDVVALTSALVDIDSTTGREGAVVTWLASRLREQGYTVTEQPVDGDRRNIFASLGRADAVFSTHLDCVPPFFPSSRRGETLFGRGACDAKGAAASQIAAAERLRRDGRTDIALLFVVGEERGSDGARAAQSIAPGSRYLINGEPTDNRLGVATRGVLRVSVKASGRAAHSSYPELGESAIEKLIDALVRLRAIELPSDPIMGLTHYTVGVISGGVAPNVVPAAAEAEVTFRTVGGLTALRRSLETLAPLVRVDDVVEVPPITMPSVPGFETAAFPYTTDIPFLSNWGTPLLFGPGSVTVAHTDDEHVEIGELYRAVDGYVALARHLLAE